MKAIVKKQFQEFIDNITFPTMVYVYENGRITAANDQAKDIIGQNCKNVNSLWEGEARRKYSKQLLNNGSEVVFNRIMYCDNEIREVDVEINSFILDKLHILICFFEYSYKQCFVKHLSGQTPRIFWMDKKHHYLGANQSYRKDLNFWEDFSKGFGALEILNEETSVKVVEDEKLLMNTKENQYNVIQSIKRDQGQGYFSRINRMPIINKNGTVVGLIGVYNLILNREEYKRLFDNTLRENNILSEIVTKSDAIIITWVNEDRWKVEYISPNVARFGYNVEDFYSEKITWEDIIHAEDQHNYQAMGEAEFVKMLSAFRGKTIIQEYQIRKANEERAWVRGEIIPIYKKNKIVYIEGVFHDITDKKELEQELDYSKKALKLNSDSLLRILNTIDSYVCVVDKEENQILFVNEKVRENFVEEPIGKNLSDFLRLSAIEVSYCANQNQDLNFLVEKDEKQILYSEYYDRKNNRYLSIHTEEIEWSDQTSAIMISMHDVTATIEHQRNIEVQAFRDFLTGLPNRLKFVQDAEIAIEEAVKNNQQGYIFTFDLDNFKQINDGLGHEYGDLLLKLVARYLSEITQLRKRCYRIGGDEFVILLEGKFGEHLEEIVTRLFEIFRKPWNLNGIDRFCTMSMGCTMFPGDSVEPTELIRFADIAQFEAKRAGKNRISYFKQIVDTKMVERINLEKYLRKAIRKDCLEFDVYYQAVVQSKDKVVVSAEALLRWHSPELGFVNPVDFIPVSEYIGLVIPLGEFVIREAFIMCREWNSEDGSDYNVNINLSVAQLVQPNIVNRILEIARTVTVNPQNIIFEVTESLALEDVSLMTSVLHELKENGFKISLDNFGKGCSSLNYIMEMPLDYIKIDKSFIARYGTKEFNPSLLSSIIELAHSLNIQVIVEGVETRKQLEFLLFLNADLYQGYFFAKPMPKNKFFDHLNILK